MPEVPDLNVDEGMVVNVRFASGALGSFCTGCFPLGGHAQSGICLNLSTRQHRVIFETWDFAGKIHTGDGDGDVTELPVTADPFLLQNEAFLDAAANKQPGKILSSYEDTMRTLAVTLAANESARERNGAPVAV